MSKTSLAALKEQLETLFPGKWFSQTNSHRTILTGLPQIDQGITHGILRRRIAEWVGAQSCGKTTVLRSAVRNWCAKGFYVAYIDTQNNLFASDWAFVDKTETDLEEGIKQDQSQNNFAVQQQLNLLTKENTRHGKFWVVRKLREQDVLWAAEQLVRSGMFDVVILDTGCSNGLNSRGYARLQRALDRSKSALILLRDENPNSSVSATTWACDSRFRFSWTQEFSCETAFDKIISIQPNIYCSAGRDGLTQDLEIRGYPNVQNRLFTHPQIPDRRTPKARTRSGPGN